jgi:hypothetical protein
LRSNVSTVWPGFEAAAFKSAARRTQLVPELVAVASAAAPPIVPFIPRSCSVPP